MLGEMRREKNGYLFFFFWFWSHSTYFAEDKEEKKYIMEVRLDSSSFLLARKYSLVKRENDAIYLIFSGIFSTPELYVHQSFVLLDFFWWIFFYAFMWQSRYIFFSLNPLSTFMFYFSQEKTIIRKDKKKVSISDNPDNKPHKNACIYMACVKKQISFGKKKKKSTRIKNLFIWMCLRIFFQIRKKYLI